MSHQTGTETAMLDEKMNEGDSEPIETLCRIGKKLESRQTSVAHVYSLFLFVSPSRFRSYSHHIVLYGYMFIYSGFWRKNENRIVWHRWRTNIYIIHICSMNWWRRVYLLLFSGLPASDIGKRKKAYYPSKNMNNNKLTK